MKRDWKRSRFDDAMEDPQTSLVNLVDIMLVFICGLVVALVSAQRQAEAQLAQAELQSQSQSELQAQTQLQAEAQLAKSQARAQSQTQSQAQNSAAAGMKQVIEKGRELPEMPEGLRGQTAGEGMQPVGQVFKDPKTGKLILVGQ
jgi:hypothetical protein